MKTNHIYSFAILLMLVSGLSFSCERPDIDSPSSETPETPEIPENPDPENPDNPDPENPTPEARYIASQADFDALGDLSGGGEIIFRNGTYRDMNLKFSAGASESKPLTIRAETPGKVLFEGTSHLEIGGTYVTVSGFDWKNPRYTGEYLIKFLSGSSRCTLSDCIIDGSGNPVSADEAKTKWVNLYGTGNIVENCSLLNKNNMGALLVVWLEEGVEAGHVIRNNKFSRPATILDSNDEPANEQETIRLGDSQHSMQDAGCTVSGNWFLHCNGEMQEIVSGKSCGNTYSGNLFEESKGTLTLRHGNGCIVENNIFLGNDIESTGGVRIIGENHIVRNNYFERLNSVGYLSALCIVRGQENPALAGYFTVKNAEVSGNTFVDCNLAMHLNYGSSSMTEPCEKVSISNNTVVCRAEDGTSMSTDTYAVRYEYTPGSSASSPDARPQADMTFRDNKFFGKFKNANVVYGLTSLKTCPAFTRPDAEITAIRTSAGARH